MEFGFGSGVLTGIRNDVAGTTPMRFGALQDVTVEWIGDTKELFATTQYPLDAARGKTKISGKAKVAEIKAQMYNDLFFGQTLTTGALKFAWNESTTLGTGAASYTIANSGSTPLVDQGVFYVSNGNQLLAQTSAPSTAGAYRFTAATGIYAFSSFDASTGVYVNYTYNSAAGFNIGGQNPLMGNTPTFQATLMQQFENNQVVVGVYKCIWTRLTVPTRIDDYVIADLDFSAFAAANGTVFSWNSSN